VKNKLSNRSRVPLVDETAAKEELKGISRNARLYLMDRIGNGLCVIRGSVEIGRTQNILPAVDRLMVEMKAIGLFELHKTTRTVDINDERR
jgi:hypothetical protein